MSLFNFWFQNLNERKDKLFHFRGSVSSKVGRKRYLNYEVCSGFGISFQITHGEACDDQYTTLVQFGLLFLKLYITFSLLKKTYFHKDCIATWDNNRKFKLVQGRVFGFYFYEYTFNWSFFSKQHESSSRDPKWMRFSIDFLDLIFGSKEFVTDREIKTENVKFKLGGKDFTMNEIKWERRRYFRRNIPMSIYYKEYNSVNMTIEKPPMRSGKGENSWDCGDDGTYGLSMGWKHEKPTHTNTKKIKEIAVREYVNHVLRDAARYGRGLGENGISARDEFLYIG